MSSADTGTWKSIMNDAIFALMIESVLVRLDSRQTITARLRIIKLGKAARLCLNAIYCNLTLFRNTTGDVSGAFQHLAAHSQKEFGASNVYPAQDIVEHEKNCVWLLFLIKNKISDKEILCEKRCL